MQRRSDHPEHRHFESTPSTRPGAVGPPSQAPSDPQIQIAPSAMLAASTRPQPFTETAAQQVAPQATRPTLPPLSQFPPQAGPQYGSSFDTRSTSQYQGAPYAPPHDYHAPPGYQSFPPPGGVPRHSSPQSARYGEPGVPPIPDTRVSPISRYPVSNPLKRSYEPAEERPYGEFAGPSYSHRIDPSESRMGISSTSVSSTSTPTTASYPTMGPGQLSSGQSAGSVSPYAARCMLHIRQQPRAARAGPDGKDRRPIDPPPVLQLMMTDFDPDSPGDTDELQSQFVVHCRLISASSPRRDVSTLTSFGEDGAREIQRLLLGTSVASPFHTKDDPDPDTMVQHPTSGERASRAPSPSSRFFAPASGMMPGVSHPSRQTYTPNMPATFFIFADLSVRKAGEYRLEFSLMKMDPHFLSVGEKLPILHKVASQPFRVVNAKDFDQVQPSTMLVKGLIERGAGFPLKLKKGTREGGRRRTTRGEGDSGSDDDEDE